MSLHTLSQVSKRLISHANCSSRCWQSNVITMFDPHLEMPQMRGGKSAFGWKEVLKSLSSWLLCGCKQQTHHLQQQQSHASVITRIFTPEHLFYPCLCPDVCLLILMSIKGGEMESMIASHRLSVVKCVSHSSRCVTSSASRHRDEGTPHTGVTVPDTLVLVPVRDMQSISKWSHVRIHPA